MDKKRVKEFMKTHKKEIFAMALTGFIGGVIGSHIGRRPQIVLKTGQTEIDFDMFKALMNSGKYQYIATDGISIKDFKEVGEFLAKIGLDKNTLIPVTFRVMNENMIES